MVSVVSVHLLLSLLYLDGAAIVDEVNGDTAVTANEANVDEDRMRLRRVDIARRVVALRLIDDIIILLPPFFEFVYGTSHPEYLSDHLCMILYLSTSK